MASTSHTASSSSSSSSSRSSTSTSKPTSSSSRSSTSTSTSKPSSHNWKYHVFLSFRGEDTRNNFVSHLYEALNKAGIYTFRDDRKLNKGKSIAPELVEAIKESRFSLVVLSQNYASSTWCLDELAKIIECKEKFGQVVVPIFYNVDPSDVRKLKGDFAKPFAKHKESFNDKLKIKKWRRSLAKVGKLAGWDLQQYRDETIFIEHIVRDISNKLNCTLSREAGYLVGMELPVMEMEMQLDVNWNGVHMVGIWGMGGVGKTTIARVMYDRLSSQFEACCFIEDVNDIFHKHGSATLRKEFLCKILLEKNLNIWSLDEDFNVIMKRLSCKKVLAVLDNVDNLKQLEILGLKPDWFGPGSRIIITTRDKRLLEEYGVKDIYKAKFLENNHALQLFSNYAFNQNHPTKDFWDLSNSFVSYAQGLPLALIVLGRSLCNRSRSYWESELARLKEFPNFGIQNVLEISYDGLEDTERDVFLDIACFFNGENIDVVRNILDGCRFYPDRAFRVLMDKAMITISNNILSVPRLLRDMGCEIVRKESKELGKRSRLWDSEDIWHVLTNNMGTEKIEGIFLDMSKTSEMCLNSEAFARMCILRLLKFHDQQTSGCTCNVQLPDGLQFISSQLRYLNWHAYPSKSLPSNFCPKNLVELKLPYSNIEQLWAGKQPLGKLKLIDLNHSNLTIFPDLSEACKLESLNLQGCINLVEASSVYYLPKLEYLNLSDCSNLKKFALLSPSMRYLVLGGTAIEELPPSIGCLSALVTLDLRNCARLKGLPSSISELKSLRDLNIAGCSNLLKILSETGMEVPSSIECLTMVSPLFQSFYTSLKSVFRSGIRKLKSSLDGFEDHKIISCIVLSSCLSFYFFFFCIFITICVSILVEICN